MFKLIIFSIIIFILIFISLYIIHKYIKDQATKDKILKATAIITVIIHYSNVWVSYFQTGTPQVDNTLILPIYPCNICMWMLLIVSTMKNNNSIVKKVLLEFLAFGGTVCGSIGLFANEIFLNNPTFTDYSVLKGLLSHATMVFGTLFILTQGYIKVRTKDMTISCTIGLGIFAIIGGIINLLFHVFKLEPVNAMFMLEFPIKLPGFNFITLGIAGVIVAFLLSTVFEILFLPLENRWYYKANNKEV